MELDELFEIVEDALEGNSYAQLRLGDCFYNGVGVNVDYKKAAFWYEKVAEEYERVQYNLGVCYYSEQDYEKARLWFEQSAEQGCAKAQFELGRCYEKGKGVIANREKSLYWYTKSAEHGDNKARISLAYLYLEDQNLEKAEFWFAMAKQWGGWNDRYEMLKSIYERMKSITINKDNIDWFISCGGRGVIEAQYKLGEYYKQKEPNPRFKRGFLGHQNPFYWYKKAADQGHKDAQYEVGRCYVKGIGVDMNLEEGNVWLRKAADQGQIEAQRELEKYNTQETGVSANLNNSNAPHNESGSCPSTKTTESDQVLNCDDDTVPEDIIKYINSKIKINWTGKRAEWFTPIYAERRCENYDRLEEYSSEIMKYYKRRRWIVEMEFNGQSVYFHCHKKM